VVLEALAFVLVTRYHFFGILVSMKAVVCTCILALFGTATAIQWKKCAEGQADIKSVTLSPDPPSAGDMIKFDIEATSKIQVDSGEVDVAVMYKGLPIYSESKDLCERTECPVKPGPLSLAYDQYLPPIVPPGDYQVNISALSGDPAQQLLCLTVDFEIAPPPAPPSAQKALHKLGQLVGLVSQAADDKYQKSVA
jgi:hypothetical protein